MKREGVFRVGGFIYEFSCCRSSSLGGMMQAPKMRMGILKINEEMRVRGRGGR